MMFQRRLRSYLSTVQSYHNDAVCTKARSVLPLKRLETEARDALEVAREFSNGGVLNYEDYLVEELVHWFKGEFFTWVSSPRCWNCGQESTTLIGMLQPTAVELQFGAERVEGYRCQCGAEIRFPRYNDPVKLLETRKGRCGEWANAFSCLCVSLGLETRFVVDWTDHVWTEYYSLGRRRWVHVDCCECQIDKPQLYEVGWGKELNYVIAADRYGVRDVTRRYVKDWNTTLDRRQEIDEAELEALLVALRAECREELPMDLVEKLTARDEAEEIELLTGMTTPSEALPGRTTGSLEWRQSRGETGASVKRSLRPSKTRYRRVALPSGGLSVAVGCSGEKAPDEMAIQLFDGKQDTKWLDFGGGGQNGSAWIEYCIPSSAPPQFIGRYALVSANDCPGRDPAEWELQGQRDAANSDWETLDHQCDIQFTQRHQRREFAVAQPFLCRRLRLCIWQTHRPKSDAVQLAKLEFLETPQLEGKMKELFNLFSEKE